jgi:hypothetical protein
MTIENSNYKKWNGAEWTQSNSVNYLILVEYDVRIFKNLIA